MPKRSIYDKKKMEHEKNGEDAATLDSTITFRLAKSKAREFRKEAFEIDTHMSVLLNAFIDGYLEGKFTYNTDKKIIEG